jgi:hypothetical protein
LVNSELTLPSGCQLVKINIPKSLLNSLSSTAHLTRPTAGTDDDDHDDDLSMVDVNELMSNSFIINDPAANNEEEEAEEELVMDGLPKHTRFTTNVAIETLSERLATAIVEDTSDDFFFDNDSGNNGDSLEQIAVYVQKNSHLKLVLLSRATQSEHYRLNNILPIVSVSINCSFLYGISSRT